jgi:hypothetical protein
MAKNIEVDLDNPIEQAGAIAKNIIENNRKEFSEISKKYIDEDLIDGIINVAVQSKIDDSSLVIKQKIRNLIKAKVRKLD